MVTFLDAGDRTLLAWQGMTTELTESGEYPVSWSVLQSSTQCVPTITLREVLYPMTSEERHEARYQRRKAARERKRWEYLDLYDDFDRAANPVAMMCAHFDTKGGVMWKYAPAKYDQNYIENSTRSADRLQKGKNVCQGFYHFSVMERGKLRQVHSVHYTERVIRRAFCMECFVPMLSHDLIYDNGASLKNKGVTFAEKRCATHLQRFIRETGGNDGYAVMVDFKGYFSSIPHDKLFDYTGKRFHDERLMDIHRKFVQAADADKEPEERGRGLYIGPEDSQILAIAYPNDIDHFVKDGMRQKYYARYNDDSYVFTRTKEEAREVLRLLLEQYERKGIIPNPKKTQIVKLSHGFKFLKVLYYPQANGRLVRKPDHGSIVRERRKLKKFRAFMDAGEMTLEQVCQSYMSWRGHIKKGRNSGGSIRSMDALFAKLFHTKPWSKHFKEVQKHGRKNGHPRRDKCA